MSFLAYPFAAGFALIGPFVAAGLYEVSRLRGGWLRGTALAVTMGLSPEPDSN